MAKSNADYQREHRERRSAHLRAVAAERDALRAEVEGLRDALGAAEAEIERLADMACKHPSAVMQGGTCRACGQDVW